MKFNLKTIPLPKFGSFKFTHTLLWWAGVAFLIVFLLFSYLGKFVFGKESRTQLALEDGRRIEFSLKTGQFAGKIQKTKKDEPDTKTAEIKQENKDESHKNKEEDKQNDDLAWRNEDFIGPKMPDEIINALFGEDNSKTEIAVEKVSIKEISEKPVIVIIMSGIGMSASSTRDAMGLPKEITMGISPYSPSIEEWVRKIQESGHEIVLNIPMETEDAHTDNPGPYAILTQASEEDNNTRLKMLFGLIKNFQAVFSDSDEVFTRSINSVKPLLEYMKKEGKYYIYGGGYANYTLIQIADNIGYPILVNDLVLDNEISTQDINDKLQEMEKIAKEKGYVVAIAHPYPITVRMLSVWLSKMKDKDMVIAPVSLLLGKVLK